MNSAPPANTETPRGYLSDAAKRRFTITTGVLGAVFFLAQMTLPLVVIEDEVKMGSDLKIQFFLW